MIEVIKMIVPNVGVGDLKFGMKREEVIALLGEPDEREMELYDTEDGRSLESYEYHELDLIASFDEGDDWSLISIELESDFYQLEGKSIVGLKKEKLTAILTAIGVSDIEIADPEEHGVPESDLLSIPSLNMNLWVEKNKVLEIQIVAKES